LNIIIHQNSRIMKPTTLILLFTGIACTYFHSSAQTIDRSIYTTDGPVYATAEKGDTLFIGGSFTQLGYGVKCLARFKPAGLSYKNAEGIKYLEK
jgi:hypothetical protein